jgi:cysteinyl-tRNA synthetase
VKMSKSIGNIFTARKFLEAYNGEILKFLILSAHYRSPSDFADNVIQHSISGLARIYSSLAQAQMWMGKCRDVGLAGEVAGERSGSSNRGESVSFEVGPSALLHEKIKAACEDDFNTPEIFAEIFNWVRAFNSYLKPNMKPSQELFQVCQKFESDVKSIGSLLSLFQKPAHQFLNELDDMLLKEKDIPRSSVQALVDERINARKNKDFKKSDELRAQLIEMGIELRDSGQFTEWEVKK